MEWDYGAYEGRTTIEIREERPGWTLWRDGVPDGESAADVGARADRIIVELRAVGGDVVVFAHGHMLRVLPPAGWSRPRPKDDSSGSIRRGSACPATSARPGRPPLACEPAALPLELPATKDKAPGKNPGPFVRTDG